MNETSNPEFLGITIDKHLTYKDHIDKTLLKVSQSVNVLFKTKFLLASQNYENAL